MKKTLGIILAIFLCIACGGCNKGSINKVENNSSKSPQKAITKIYVYHSGFGQTTPEYLFDFKNKKVWEYYSDIAGNYKPRDVKAKNNGYTQSEKLSDEKIKVFLEQCDSHGINDWKSSYINDRVGDGHQWGLTITYDDKSEKQIMGSNAYPSTWDLIKTDFQNLVGFDVLIYSSDWLENQGE